MTTKKYGLVNHEIKSCLPFPAEHESPLTRRTEIRSQSTVTLHGGCCLNRVHVTPLREKYHKMIHVSLVHKVYHQNKQKVVTGLGVTTTTQENRKTLSESSLVLQVLQPVCFFFLNFLCTLGEVFGRCVCWDWTPKHMKKL